VRLRNLLFATAILPLAAQDPPAPLVQIYREQIKPGKIAAYVRIEEAAARFCAKMNCPNPYFALTSLTGPNEVWWINGFDSPETIERVWQAYASSQEIMTELNSIAENKADLAFPANILLAKFHPEMSFYTTPVAPHYISMSIVHVRLGHVANFRDMRIRFKSTLERAGRPQWAYQVTSGTDDVTFIVMTPARTMQEIQTTPSLDDPSDIVVSSETRLYAVSPAMSLPAQSWVEADPDFWKRP
jgi:hypothetical protein